MLDSKIFFGSVFEEIMKLLMLVKANNEHPH